MNRQMKFVCGRWTATASIVVCVASNPVIDRRSTDNDKSNMRDVMPAIFRTKDDSSKEVR